MKPSVTRETALQWLQSQPWQEARVTKSQRRAYAIAKRCLDVSLSVVGLILVAVPCLLLAIAIKLDSPGPVLFRQTRMGRNMKPFEILKLRSMSSKPSAQGSLVTIGEDQRITRVGRWIRRFKLDELPQLWNVLRGDMSFVGPRPEVISYVQAFPEAYRYLLQWRPGITDLASLVYRGESELLATYSDPHRAYMEEVLPHKLYLSIKDRREATFGRDLKRMLQTILGLAPVL